MKSSENWGMYMSNSGNFPAMVVYDDGISDQIDKVELFFAIKIKLHLREFSENGLPTSTEGERLVKIGPIIEDIINENGGLFLGRVTTNKVRWNLGLIGNNSETIKAKLSAAAIEHDFEHEFQVQADPEKIVYWKDLYPSHDDRQIMRDMQVISALADGGDTLEAERNVDHWAYFPTQEGAQSFTTWLGSQGYHNAKAAQEITGFLAKPCWSATFSHTGTMILEDISYHTISVSKQAIANGGEYDGWETQLVQGN